MKSLVISLSIILFSIFFIIQAHAGGTITITEPGNQTTISSPVKVCLKAHDIVVEPAKNGINAGKGHHHLIINSNLPEDLSQPIGKDRLHIHMGDGSICKELKMAPGKHIIKALFAKGNHVPYNPIMTSAIFITVDE